MMSMCMAFPRAGAGFSAKRHRYDQLIDATKVVKEEVEKERREKSKEWWRHNNKWYNKKSEGANYTPTTWNKKRRHLEWEQKYDHDYYYYYRSSASFNSSERRRRRQRRRDEYQDEIKPFERRSCSLMSSWEKKKKVPALPVAITSVYANKTKTKKEEEELSSSSETSSSSCRINDEEETTNKRSLWCSEKEELEYKKLEVELEKMVPLYAASLPPLDLDWLYPKTSTKKDEDERRAEKQRKISLSLSLSLSSSDAEQNRSLGPPRAQYLHDLHIFALPYVLPF